MACEAGSTYSRNPEEVTCHWQSICLKATLRVTISLREIFSKSGFLRVMGKQDESTIKDILEEFGTP